MKTNTAKKAPIEYTHEGTRAANLTPLQQLRRSVLSCLLWENEHYEDGVSIAERIKALIAKVEPEEVAALAVEAREGFKLRHTPLFIVREMARLETHKHLVADTLYKVIQRADELGEFLAIYWKEKRQPVSGQVKRGLARAFEKFEEFDFAKWDKDAQVTLRDVMFIAHPKPANKQREKLYTRIANRELKTPDTWEVALSAGKDKKATFERLIKEGKLGALALLRNLRGMKEAGVSRAVIKKGIEEMRTERVLPFRFITAAKYAPDLEPELEAAMVKCLDGVEKLAGKTALVVDTSPSMWQAKLSAKSEMDRFEAAAGLAALAREICEDVAVYAFNLKGYRVPSRRGFALRDALAKTNDNYSRGGLAVEMANEDGYDRIIVLTDGQWHPMRDGVGLSESDPLKASPKPLTDKAYMINLDSYKNGVGYGNAWNKLDGWSEAVLSYIVALEADEVKPRKKANKN